MKKYTCQKSNKITCHPGGFPDGHTKTTKACHPELAAPLVADNLEAYKGGCSKSISGSYQLDSSATDSQILNTQNICIVICSNIFYDKGVK